MYILIEQKLWFAAMVTRRWCCRWWRVAREVAFTYVAMATMWLFLAVHGNREAIVCAPPISNVLVVMTLGNGVCTVGEKEWGDYTPPNTA